MGRDRKGYIVDTNILVSKKIRELLRLGADLYVTPTIILEYLNWAIAQRNKMLKRGLVERAKGYERLIEMFPELLESLGIMIVSPKLDIEEVSEATRLIRERSINPGDALIALAAKQLGLGVISNDKDWERLQDYVTDWVTL